MSVSLQNQKICFENVTFGTVANKVRQKLGCGVDRINDSFSWKWWPERVNWLEDASFAYTAEPTATEVAKEFQEEVTVIRETLVELGYTNKSKPKSEELPVADDGIIIEREKTFWQTLQAMSVWDYIGNPVRLKGNFVFRILSPRDLFGSPKIQVLPLDTYVNELLEQTERDYKEITTLRKERFFLAVASVALILSLLFVWITIDR